LEETGEGRAVVGLQSADEFLRLSGPNCRVSLIDEGEGLLEDGGSYRVVGFGDSSEAGPDEMRNDGKRKGEDCV